MSLTLKVVMLKRYGLQTKSGSFYYLEDHTHLLRAPTWMIKTSRGDFFVTGVRDDESGTNTDAGKIKSVHQFLKKIVFYNSQNTGHIIVFENLNTTMVVNIIVFK